jgi:hypothetical protein
VIPLKAALKLWFAVKRGMYINCRPSTYGEYAVDFMGAEYAIWAVEKA